MPKHSAGLLLWRRSRNAGVVVLLVHPGGPYWAGKDDGAWSVPKGEYQEGEDPHDVALREFAEELGTSPPAGVDVELGEIRQRGGKHVVAWARQGDLDVSQVDSNTFEMEWPPRSGRMRTFPEVDRAGWFPIEDARRKILASQLPLLDRLEDATVA